MEQMIKNFGVMVDLTSKIKEEEDLKECPFCNGSKIKITDHGRERKSLFHFGEKIYTIGCYDCGAQFPAMYEDYGKRCLINQWNTRFKK